MCAMHGLEPPSHNMLSRERPLRYHRCLSPDARLMLPWHPIRPMGSGCQGNFLYIRTLSSLTSVPALLSHIGQAFAIRSKKNSRQTRL